MQNIFYPYSRILMKTFEIREKNGRKIQGCTCKNTNIPYASCSRVPTLVLYQCLDIELLPYGRIGKISNLNIHEFNEMPEMNENSWESQGVFSQNYSYLNCLVP